MEKLYTYLALGDSYTIGEAVPLQKSFPYQVTRFLRQEGVSIAAPEIIARTGWTTDELAAGMAGYPFLNQYDFVTILIGVNNQYRGRRVEEYSLELESLIRRALTFVHKKQEHIMVLSIPDYSVTPFAQKLDKDRITAEIDQFNAVKRALATQYKVPFLDITPGTRKAYSDLSLLAADGLHPSEKEYSIWAELVATQFKKIAR